MVKKLSLFKREPAALIGLGISALSFLISIGLSMNGKIEAVHGLLVSLIPLLTAFGIRTQVSSPATVAKTAVETAARVSPGPDTQLSTGAVSEATAVVAETLGTTVDVAGDLVGGVLGGLGKVVKGVL